MERRVEIWGCSRNSIFSPSDIGLSIKRHSGLQRFTPVALTIYFRDDRCQIIIPHQSHRSHSYIYSFIPREDLHPPSSIPQHPSSINKSTALSYYKSSNSFSYSTTRLHARSLNRPRKALYRYNQTCLTPNAMHVVPPTISRHQTQTMRGLGSRWSPLPRPPSLPIRPWREFPLHEELIVRYLLQMPTMRSNLPPLPPKHKALVTPPPQINPITPTPTQSTTGVAATVKISIFCLTAQNCAHYAHTWNVYSAP